jgi:hypothetical protein
MGRDLIHPKILLTSIFPHLWVLSFKDGKVNSGQFHISRGMLIVTVNRCSVKQVFVLGDGLWVIATMQ